MHGCRSAYPSLEEAKKAAMPILQSDDGDIESFDPNEVMAKAYMTKKEEESSSSATASGTKAGQQQEGPLAFLGLQQKSQDEDSSQDSKSEEKEIGAETTEKEPEKTEENSKEQDESEKDEHPAVEEVMDED